jgi:hypothetical protein
MILGISSYLFAISSSWGCYYVEIGASFTQSLPGVTGNYRSGVGLFSYEDVFDYRHNNGLTCYYYSSEQIDTFDGAFRTARVFGILANICIGISMLLLIGLSCFEYSQLSLHCIGSLLLVGALFEMLTFILFGSELCAYGCDFYIGAGLTVACVIVSSIATLIVFHVPPAREREVYASPEQAVVPYAPGTETLTQTIMPDGTKKMTKTTVHGDGSKTVEETIDEPN